MTQIGRPLTVDSSDLELLAGHEIDTAGLEKYQTFRKVTIWRYPRERSRDGRQYYTYYAIIRYAECWGVLKGVTLSGIRSQIGRCCNGLQPSDCSICEYHRPRTPISPEYCHWTIDPQLTGFHGCPRFEVSR